VTALDDIAVTRGHQLVVCPQDLKTE